MNDDSGERVAGDERLARIDAALRTGRGASVVDEACALVDAHPGWRDAQRAYLRVLLEWSATQPELVTRAFPPPPAHRPVRVSVLVCSNDRGRFDNVVANLRGRFAAPALEIVGIHDARSLAEGYNRAAAKATGDLLVFAHDDIALVTDDFAPRLCAHLERYDGVGVAGASRIAGPRWDHADPDALHGHVLHPPPEGARGMLLFVAGLQRPIAESVRVLDGAFLAVRRHVWEAHRFDEARYDGFHLYDLDFTSRASAAGARLAVPADLLLLHRSRGRFGDAWRRYADRFVAQHGLDPAAKPTPGGLQVRLDTGSQVDALRAALLHFRYGAPRQRA
jgi:hypothetical protein